MPVLYKRCKCGTKIPHTEKYCEECRKQIAGISNKQYNIATRDMALHKFYNSAQWKKIRAQVLASEPFCRICGREAQMVDHIVEIKDGGSKTAYDNLQPLCYACHNKKTAKNKNE